MLEGFLIYVRKYIHWWFLTRNIQMRSIWSFRCVFFSSGYVLGGIRAQYPHKNLVRADTGPTPSPFDPYSTESIPRHISASNVISRSPTGSRQSPLLPLELQKFTNKWNNSIWRYCLLWVFLPPSPCRYSLAYGLPGEEMANFKRKFKSRLLCSIMRVLIDFSL